MKQLLLMLICVVMTTGVVWADSIRGIDIDFVTINHAPNAGDTRTLYPDRANPYGCGAVTYDYRIGKYEISAAQWQLFEAAVGNIENETGTGNQAVGYISFGNAARFCNYLTTGDPEIGVYSVSGDAAEPQMDRQTANSIYGIAYFIPTEDEWYKAAYYTGTGYSTFANGTGIAPIAGVNSNYANAIGHAWDITMGTMEQNGTFNMMGNLWEWNEKIVNESSRGTRGSAWDIISVDFLGTTDWSGHSQSGYPTIGFRVASTIPEPATLLLLGLGGLALRRRGK